LQKEGSRKSCKWFWKTVWCIGGRKRKV